MLHVEREREKGKSSPISNFGKKWLHIVPLTSNFSQHVRIFKVLQNNILKWTD